MEVLLERLDLRMEAAGGRLIVCRDDLAITSIGRSIFALLEWLGLRMDAAGVCFCNCIAAVTCAMPPLPMCHC
jgi:hypothetical protein